MSNSSLSVAPPYQGRFSAVDNILGMGIADIHAGFPVVEESPQAMIAELEEKLALQVNKFTDVARVGTVVTSLLDLDRILPMVMESALAVVGAEVGQIVLFDKDGGIASDVCWGLSKKVTTALTNADGLSLWESIWRNGESIKIDDMSHMGSWSLGSDEVNINCLLAVPLKAGKRIVGGAAVANKIIGAGFDENDLFSFEMLAGFTAVAVENSTLHAQALAQQKLEAQLEMARQVQATLMPVKTGDYGRLVIRAHNRMAMQLGGDFYDIIEFSPSKYLLVVADVSNKGFPAALLMTSARSLVRAYAVEPINLPAIAHNVNLQLCRDSRGLGSMFVTMILVYLDFNANSLESVNAGHPPGFLRSPDGGVRELKVGGPFLGQFDNLEYRELRLPLEKGSRLFLYTDGAFECVDSQGQMLGLTELRRFFNNNCERAPEDFLKAILEMLGKYAGDPDRIDDTTFVLADVR